MTPIEKNVIVVDEFGNEYGATYPKRAKGLVKNGRARFIDENRICLACPPQNENETEDIKMSENMNIEAMENVEIVAGTTKYTIDYVLEQIAKLQQQITESSYHSLHRLSDAVYSICENDSESDGSDDGEESRNSSVACVCEIFRYREVTLQKMITLYEKMYDDLKPKAPEPVDPVLKTITDMLALDKSEVKTEFQDRIMIQMVEYAEHLKANAMQPSPEERQDKREKINLLLAHLSECQNDSAACHIGDELHRLMND